MKKKGIIINQKEHTDIYEWLYNNVWYYKKNQNKFTLTSEGKINADCEVSIHNDITQFKYHFNVVSSGFNCCGCDKLTSFIGSPIEVRGFFYCSGCDSLTSLIGAPEKIERHFDCINCENLTSFIGLPKIINGGIYLPKNNFSNNPSDKKEYKLYLAMWLELLESVNNEERKEYITNYKYKTNDYNEKTIIPVEILKEYGF